MFIALDLETTGIDKEKDQIIEVAAAKFENGKIIDTYQSFVKPSIPIPEITTQITGIVDQDVVDAPKFEEIAEEFKNFIGDLPIVGHFIKFDIDFLAENNLPLENPQYDTFELTSVLIQGLPSYSLEVISQIFGLDHLNKHRALDDSIAAIHLFELLQNKISQIPEKPLKEIQTILTKSNWQLKPLFLNPLQSTPQETTPITYPKPQTTPIPPSAYTPFEESLTNKTNLLYETPYQNEYTPLYFTPAIKTNQSCLIALPQKEINQNSLQHYFEHSKKLAESTSATLNFLHPPNQYLSIKKLEELKAKPNLTTPETTLIVKIILWLEQTQTGHSSEIKIDREEKKIWPAIACDSESLANQEDFFTKAYKTAQKSTITVTSQEFLSYSHNNQLNLIPEFKNIIIPGASQLDKTSTKGSTLYFTLKSVENILSQTPPSPEIESFNNKLTILIGLIAIFFHKHSVHQNYEKRIIITPELSTNIEWKNLLQAANNLLEESQTINSSPSLQNQFKNLKRILENINSPSHTTWIYNFEDSYGFNCANTEATSELITHLTNTYASIMLCDSALDINDNFTFIKTNLSLNDSFIQYKNNSLDIQEKNIAISNGHLVSPTNKNFQTECNEFIDDFIANKKGKTFIICSSRKAIESIYDSLALKYKEQSITLLAQNLTGSKGKIIEKFKETPEASIIIGTEFFWETINPSELEIENLIIQKIPYEIFSDPIIIAKTSQLEDSFSEYLLPQAVLKFKKITNNFIYSSGNTKNITILDSRIEKNSYGEMFQKISPYYS